MRIPNSNEPIIGRCVFPIAEVPTEYLTGPEKERRGSVGSGGSGGWRTDPHRRDAFDGWHKTSESCAGDPVPLLRKMIKISNGPVIWGGGRTGRPDDSRPHPKLD
jgi:hypothetical protein